MVGGTQVKLFIREYANVKALSKLVDKIDHCTVIFIFFIALLSNGITSNDPFCLFKCEPGNYSLLHFQEC
jgi:hypothetical protein